MADEKPAIVMANRERDRELLIPVADFGDKNDGSSSSSSSKPSSSSSSSHQSSHETLSLFIRGWASKKFMTGCVILLPIAITFYITWLFVHFVDGFFSPIYAQLGINVFGFGFLTSIAFVFLVGVFMSSWLGASVLNLGEWFIKRMPFVRHIYNASKQISSAISPDQNTQAFKEVAIIRHPRMALSHQLLFSRITQPRRSFAVYMFPQTTFTSEIYYLSTVMMLSGQTSLYAKE